MSNFKPLSPKVVLGIVAHPDDLELGASGTMAYFANNGADVYYLILTDGSKGSKDKSLSPKELIRIRQDEQRSALKIIGGKSVIFLNYPDAELEVTMKLKKDIVKVIREIKPDVVITIDPSMLYSAERGYINHPDHRAAGQATLDSVFPLARDHLSFPELYEAGLGPHKTSTVLLINFADGNHVIDITTTMDKKISALKAHPSQFNISKVAPFVHEMATEVGEKAGYEKGEQFIRIDIN
jgi:LmbE family N-acetylglucosaminyl deacetylase